MERAVAASHADAHETAAFVGWLRANHPSFGPRTGQPHSARHLPVDFDLDAWLRIFESACPRRVRAEYAGVTAACEGLLHGATGHEALLLRESGVSVAGLLAARDAAAASTRVELQACRDLAKAGAPVAV
jgi:hypothetical protein